ncbi:MAG: DUF1643 domain-containing protein [Cyanobacteria bacterium SZAS LIN-3]|nr:DUF1643 domain-containing protein [Cyanobacteria bacterium SZAS LIN-3]
MSLITLPDVPSGAIFDKRRRYRYLLWRSWAPALPAVSFVMLNPSAADEHFNDPTITRSISLAQEQGFGRLFVVNLFAYMTKSPVLLKSARYPVSCRIEAREGRHNDDFIRYALGLSDQVVLAWGNHGSHQGRHREIIDMIKSAIDPADCFVFAMTKQGQPRHPLYTPKSIGLQPAPDELFALELAR